MTACMQVTALALSFAGVVGSSPFVPFDQFLDHAKAASFERVMAENDARYRVRDGAAFDEMRQHILQMYDGVEVEHSFLDDHHFDCVAVHSQPSVRASGASIATPPPLLTSSTGHMSLAQGRHDDFGNALECLEGTIPMLRLSFDRLLRFHTLNHFFAKTPAGPTSNSSLESTGSAHKYAHAYQSVANEGGTSEFEISNPSGDFTLSQHWYSAYLSSGSVQTAECGNVHYPDSGWNPAVLFVYHTNNGYAAGSGCYNLDCAGFVQVDNTYALAGKWPSYSSDGGIQTVLSLGYQFYEGNWWLHVGGKFIGYYPGSVYNGGPMAQGATGIDFGGETYTSGSTWPQMGSGEFASSGWKRAAFHRNINYYSGGIAHTAALNAIAYDTTCYTIDQHAATDGSNWGAYFYFGGPGGSPCSSAVAAEVVV